jgi:hypothetical protein
MPAQMELIGQAKALANDLKWSEAADALAGVLADYPENIVLLDKRGWYLSRAKRYAEAIAVYEFLTCQSAPRSGEVALHGWISIL